MDAERDRIGRYELRREPRSGVGVVVVWWGGADGQRMQLMVIGNDGAVRLLGEAVARYLAGRQPGAELPARGLLDMPLSWANYYESRVTKYSATIEDDHERGDQDQGQLQRLAARRSGGPCCRGRGQGLIYGDRQGLVCGGRQGLVCGNRQGLVAAGGRHGDRHDTNQIRYGSFRISP
jgi:hypothetical protein